MSLDVMKHQGIHSFKCPFKLQEWTWGPKINWTMRIQLTGECHWCWSPQSCLSHSSFWLPFSFLPTFNVFGFTTSCLSVLPKGKHPRFPEQSKGTMRSHEGWALLWKLVCTVLPPLPLPSLAHLNIFRGSLPSPLSVECCTVVSEPCLGWQDSLLFLIIVFSLLLTVFIVDIHCHTQWDSVTLGGDFVSVTLFSLHLGPAKLESSWASFSKVITVLSKGKSPFVYPSLTPVTFLWYPVILVLGKSE